MIAKILRQLKPFKGKQRLSRFLLQKEIKEKRDFNIDGKYGCKYFIPNIIENVGFDIYVDGVFEDDTIQYIVSRLPERGVFIDIGANIGSIATPVCKIMPSIKAIAIEASPRVYQYLHRNQELNGLANCLTVNKALSDIDGQMVDFFSPEEKFGKGSMSSVFTKNAERVETVTLDTLLLQNKLTKVDFIKADIKGYESHAFRGAARLLSLPDAPDILFEFVDWAEAAAAGTEPGDAQRVLLAYGYKLYTFSGKGDLHPLTEVLTKENAMILATKK